MGFMQRHSAIFISVLGREEEEAMLVSQNSGSKGPKSQKMNFVPDAKELR